MSAWTCASCNYVENEYDSQECDSCGEARAAAGAAVPTGSGGADNKIVVGLITSITAIAGKDKLRTLVVDAGSDNGLVTVVTNAPNVAEGFRVVVALPGARIDSGGEEIVVKAASVGGVRSGGMLCDATMLRWTGGGAGTAALVPDSYKPGDAPPAQRPRLK
jgi:tRNA-binding EMAP/Myf-like protein